MISGFSQVLLGFIELTVHSGTGGEITKTQKVMVLSENTSSGMGNITARPNLLSRQTGYTVTFSSDSAQNPALSVKIFNMAGEKIWQGTGQPGTNDVVWNASRVANGLYFAVVEALSPEGGLMGRKSLKLVVIH